MAQGSQRQILYVAETTPGTIPSTPSMSTLRNNGGNGITQSRSQLLSQEMRSDRQIASMRLGQRRPSLDVPFELSYGSFDDILESLMFNPWDTSGAPATPDFIETGTTLRSFSMEEGFLDIPAYVVGRGMVADTMSLSARPDAIVTGSFGFLGLGMEAPSATPLDATPAAPATTEVMTAFEGQLTVDGTPVSIITGIDINVANGLDPKFPVFQQDAYRMGYGRVNVNGTIIAFFENTDLLTRVTNETEIALVVTFEDVAGNQLRFTMPRVKLGSETRNVQENEITESIPFQALFDSVSGTNTLRIERIPV